MGYMSAVNEIVFRWQTGQIPAPQAMALIASIGKQEATNTGDKK
tara:strand:+ start:1151 stop:1282 length:132 start_codon:yes stop_codon:yes gene_type:complete